ncbi:3,4-dihydroxy-2-butanone-4-phosphate synthase [Austwickia chelonae]|uniref:3,4-dihydroxy-2-butanone-4-phosphate synthase n=1 Tax=Austwickia chelonae TaxID=100225 RepID=UPI000E21F181|nr:3,4-dihydroxy-2-butanone-4-phosphate synthase [Austwickia chelonae]
MAEHTADAGFASIEAALAAMRAGRPVLVLDSADRENEGDVILAGQTLTTSWLAWTIRHSSGYVCVPMTADRADELQLPSMVVDNEDPRGTAYAVSCDAATGVSTGISAADRARTIRLLADPDSGPEQFVRPGHVLPLRAHPGGVAARAGHTEAGVELARAAGLSPVAAIAELVHDDGTMMRAADVLRLGDEHRLPVITIVDLQAWLARGGENRRAWSAGEPSGGVAIAGKGAGAHRVVRHGEAQLPTEYGVFQMVGYADLVTGAEHLALISPVGLGDRPVVRVHSECLTGDALGSLRCDCGPQLQEALATVAAQGGVVVYVRGHEGRGVGLLAKVSAYGVQDLGADTVDAQVRLGLPIDDREYGGAAAILTDLGVGPFELLTNNPLKITALQGFGLEVIARREHHVGVNPANVAYLATKRDRMGHLLSQDQHIPSFVSPTEG